MKNNKTLLLVDGNNQMYRAHHTHEFYRFKGKPTSILYGVPDIISANLKRVRPDKVVVFFDGKKHPKRRELTQDQYKAQRQEKQLSSTYDLMMGQQEPLKVLLMDLGIDVVHNILYEADDLIYYWVNNNPEYNQIYIMSSDKDFHQLLDDRVNIVHPEKGIITRKNVKTHYGYTKAEAVAYLCLVGDKSDNLKGVGGIGPVKARKILDDLKARGLKPRELFKSRIAKEYIGNKESIERLKTNRVLIDFKVFFKRYGISKTIDTDAITMGGKYDIRRIKAALANYGLKRFNSESFLSTFESIKNI